MTLCGDNYTAVSSCLHHNRRPIESGVYCLNIMILILMIISFHRSVNQQEPININLRKAFMEFDTSSCVNDFLPLCFEMLPCCDCLNGCVTIPIRHNA